MKMFFVSNKESCKFYLFLSTMKVMLNREKCTFPGKYCNAFVFWFCFMEVINDFLVGNLFGFTLIEVSWELQQCFHLLVSSS